MGKNNRTNKSPWLKLKKQSSVSFLYLILIVILGIALSVILSYFMVRVFFSPDGLAFGGKSVAGEPYPYVDLNYPTQVRVGDFDEVFLDVRVSDAYGPLQGKYLALQLGPVTISPISQFTNSQGFSRFIISIPAEISSEEKYSGFINVDGLKIDVEIFLLPPLDATPEVIEEETPVAPTEVAAPPENVDTDGDGVFDAEERLLGTDPDASNIVSVEIPEGQPLSVFDSDDTNVKLFDIDGNTEFSFFLMENDENYQYGFIDGYLDEGNYDEEQDTFVTPFELFKNPDLADPIFELLAVPAHREFIDDPTENDVSKHIRIFFAIPIASSVATEEPATDGE